MTHARHTVPTRNPSVAECRADFPGPGPGRQRTAARIPRQRGLGATAVRRHRCDRSLRASRSRQRASWRAHAESSCDRRLRRRTRQARALSSTPSSTQRGGIHQRHHGVHQPGRTELLPAAAQPGRQDPDHPPRASLQYRALAARLRADRRGTGRRPDQRARRARTRCALRAHGRQRYRLLAIAHVSNALGTINPVKDIIADSAPATYRCCSTAPKAFPT